MYSSKTYYQEEIYKRDNIAKRLETRVEQLERKQNLLKQRQQIDRMIND